MSVDKNVSVVGNTQTSVITIYFLNIFNNYYVSGDALGIGGKILNK